MKKILLVTVLFIALLISGCRPLFIGDTSKLIAPIDSDVQSTPTVNEPKPSIGTDKSGIIVNNAAIYGNNVNAGSHGEFSVLLMNTAMIDTPIDIYFTQPSSLREGYVYIGDSAKEWIVINPNKLVVKSKDIVSIVVTLSIPKDAILPSGNLEFWISYSYKTGGFLNYVVNQRWLLSRE